MDIFLRQIAISCKSRTIRQRHLHIRRQECALRGRLYCVSKKSNKCIAVRKVATPLRELACHMRSHSVTCHPAEVTFPPVGSVKKGSTK